LFGDPVRQLEGVPVQERRRIEKADQRLEARRHPLAQSDDDTDALGVSERRDDALPRRDRQAVGNEIGERMRDRRVERDVCCIGARASHEPRVA
jgi:hypothetical protein